MLPGFELIYGGPYSQFSTFKVGSSSGTFLNLELASRGDGAGMAEIEKQPVDFGRVIFHTSDVDALYRFIKDSSSISDISIIESEPADAPWGERYFHARDPDGYQLSFARPIPAKS